MKKPNVKYQYLSFIFTILFWIVYVQITETTGPVRTASAADPVIGASVMALPGQDLGLVASSPDGNILALAASDGKILLWNVTSGQTPITLSSQIASPVSGIAVGPDGKTVASISDNSIRLWDTESGGIRLILPQSVPVTNLAFSPDGKTLAAIDEEARVTLMDPQSGSITQQLLTGQTDVKAIAFSPDSTMLATGSQDAQTKLWTVASGREEASLAGKAAVTELAFSPDGKTLAAAGEGELVFLWDVANKLPQLLTGHKDLVVKVVFSSDQKSLTSMDRTGQVIVWNLLTGEKQVAFQGLPSNVAVAGLPGTAGNSIANTSATATGAADSAATNTSTVQGSVANQNAKNAKNANKNISKRNWKGVTALAVSRDGTLIGDGTQDGQIKLWTSAGAERFTVPSHHGAAVTGVVFSADGKNLVSGGRDTEVQTRDAATGEPGQTFLAHEHPIRAVAASADGKHFASAGEETRVMLWDVQARKLKNILNGHSDFVNAVCFSADGTHLASAGADGRILWWNVETGQLERTLLAHADEVNAVACSPDGKFVVSGGSDTLVILWDVATGEPIQRFEGHQASVRAVAFSPNGQELVSTGEDTKILVWNTATRQLDKQIAASTKAINALAYGPPGNLISGDEGGEVAEWDTKKGQKSRTFNGNGQPQVKNPDRNSSVSLIGSPGSIPASRGQVTRSDIFIRILDWLIPSAEAALPDPEGPGGPILVVTSLCLPCGTFDKYYAEILRAEGLNEFAVADVDSVTTAMLNSYDVVILGQMPLTPGQVTMFTDWVTAGGNLIAMKPDKQLASLLGLQDAGPPPLSNGYLLIDTTTSPGNGIGVSGQPMQFHGTADRYTLNGASSIATLYSSFSTATSSPAITLRSGIGTGGHAAAFTYDLATSIVYMRQGNPVWAEQERDGLTPIRSDDKFFGNTEPDWVDLQNEVAVPQADEQQRLLTNLILEMNRNKKPLPRFWYFPRGEKAVVIMTGDDHGNNGTQGRFDYFKSVSPPGCSVANWECVRGTSYIYPNTSQIPGNPLTNAEAAAYAAEGFEVGLHVSTNCTDFTLASLRAFYTQQIQDFTSKYSSIPAPVTQRHHCIVWSDWATGATVQLENNIRFDVNYYFWPPGWVQNRPGFFSGSGMPMRFINLDGSLIDVYHATSQMTDESGQTYPFTINTLLDRALGPEGYYGAYTINAHTDVSVTTEATTTVESAQARGVPIVSSKQMLDWLDSRNGSSFGSLTWNGTQLSFAIARNSAANGLQTMLPITSGTGGSLTGITGPSGAVQFTISTIKGIQYAFFTAATGTYTANYGTDTTPPTVSSTFPANNATGISPTAAVTATFSEAMQASTITASTFELRDAGNNLVPAAVSYAGNTATLTPNQALSVNTTYTATVKGGATGVKDLAGNALASNATWSFTTGSGGTSACSGGSSIWASTTTPASAAVTDGLAIEIGVKFRPNVNGFICGIRFYKGNLNTGSHDGTLWSSSGQQLATATFTNETASGWQQVNFATPVAVTANTVYIASYHSESYFALNEGYFTSAGVTNGPLYALRDGESGGNGVYRYGTRAFPTSTFGGNNYWVDVVFTTTSPGSDTTPPTVSSTVPVADATGVSPTAPVTATFSEAMQASTITASTFELRTANTLVPAAVSYSGNTATLTPNSALAANTTYTATVKGGATGVKDLAGNPLATDRTWTFTTGSTGTLACSGGSSIWSSATTPAIAAVTDGQAIELGVKFRPNVNGFICGIRFYKGSLNTGTHEGTLWSSTGQQLATATFINETASGWQQVNFTQPVAVTANTIYIASYHSTGYFALNEGYFNSAGVTNGPLYALRNGENGGNGVYRYGASGFPTSTFNGNNYWVDVVFTTSVGPDTTPPTVTATVPASGATGVSPTAAVTSTFSEAMQASTITASTFELRDAGNNLVPAAVSYAGNTATLTPNQALSVNTAYTATVKGGATGVKDLAGNALASDRIWSFTTGANPCLPEGNPIVCENTKTGNPSSEWDIIGAGDPTIQGFATDISVNKGTTVSFKISTPASAYRLDIYRMGYYGGNGARKVATVNGTGPQNRAGANPTACLTDSATGLIDCGNWTVSASWSIPADAVSGIYFAKLVRSDTNGASHIVFVVRDDSSTSPLLFQTSDTTWQAYNSYGGNSLYTGNPGTNPGRAYKVSYNRPFNTRAVDTGHDWVFNAEYPMVRWLEANGYNVSYFTGVDSDRLGDLISNHKVFLSVGHDEYWSDTQLMNVENARNAGVHLAFFSGNEIFWKTRWEDSIDGSSHRTLVCYKETHANAKIDPTSAWTGTWLDPSFSPPADGGRPQNALTGTLFMVNEGATTAITVPAEDGKMRFWRNTSVANLATGSATLAGSTLGYEWDVDPANPDTAGTQAGLVALGFRPAGLFHLSTTTVATGGQLLQDYGSTYGPGSATHNLTLYKHSSGALVFGAGTVQWSWGLDSNHDLGSGAADPRIQQATVNLLADMEVQPGTLLSGLVTATASTDTSAPTSTITSPAANSTVSPDTTVTITGTATDTGGVVGGVEVSVDGGLAWHPASGRGNWSYSWRTPSTSTAANIRSRAVDDSGNLGASGTGITVNVGAGADTTPPTVTGRSPAAGATGIATSTAVTATFSEALDMATITESTFELRDAANTLVPATVSYNGTTRTATLTPNAALAPSTTYTAILKGGATDPRVKDVAGNALAANVTWSFSTAGILTNTGFLSPSANAAVTANAGDNNGFQTTPGNGYADDGLFAVDTDSGTGMSTSCTANGKDKHIYYNYGFNLPTGSLIAGIEVRLDAKVDSNLLNNPNMCVQLSWDGGTTWTAAKRTATLTTSEATYVLGGPADTWGRTWTLSNLSNTGYRVRIINVASSVGANARDFSLDWVAVRVSYL
jgi:WD40 repeat protein